MFVNLKVRNNDDDAAYSSEVAVAYPPGLSYIGPGSQVQCLVSQDNVRNRIGSKGKKKGRLIGTGNDCTSK